MMPHTARSAAGTAAAVATTYPTWLGFVYVFNLIVGTGALTLPAVFAKAGWLMSFVSIALLAFMSYIAVTYIIEAMACANAVRYWQQVQFAYDSSTVENLEQNNADDADADSDATDDCLLPRELEPAPAAMSASSVSRQSSSTLSYYQLHEKFELGEMAALFFNDIGRMLFYLCIAIYLYGDLSIYTAAIAKTLRDIVCDIPNSTVSGSYNISPNYTYNLPDQETFVVPPRIGDATPDDVLDQPCWVQHTLSRQSVYRLLLIGFAALFGPFAAFSVQKTKYLQMLTIVFRWLAFTLMIALATKSLISNGAQGHPPAANIYGLPSLFGACVYSFMCHHSLPSLLTPIRHKSGIKRILICDYLLICVFYILLAMTGIFAFAHLQDLYTLNFIPPAHAADHTFRTTLLIVIDYFLALFPVFTLCASFPIIAITLRNNLQTLFLDMAHFEAYNLFVRRIVFPLAAVLPPFCITYFTENLTSLVSFTGSYAGAGIQYLIPISLVYFGRRTCRELLGNGVINEFQSAFSRCGWLTFVLIWCFACMLLVTINLCY